MKKLLIVLALIPLPLSETSYLETKWLSVKDMRCLADNVYHEARGEPFWGQVLVARVTLNRSEKFNQSLCQVVYAPFQFSWTLRKLKPINRKSKEYDRAFEASHAAFSIQYPALYYHSTKVHPHWAKSFVRLGKYGNHIFYH